MRMYALLMACATTGVALTLVTSPLAQADNASFVRDAQALGFTQESDNLISTGRGTCYSLFLNRDPDELAFRIKRYLNVEQDLANRFFVMTVNEYCPQFGGAIDRLSDS